jgi:cellulose synthase/poly-beta-1,6-N-acetylglucosamine synthase-like glycosyltransferase
VIIPAYNASRTLGRCLESLSGQDQAPWQIVLVDDASTDDTVSIARQAGAEVVSCESQQGPARARNLGVEATTGDVILFLDADVTVPPDLISRVCEIFEGDDTLAAVQTIYSPVCPSDNAVTRYQNFYYYYAVTRHKMEWVACIGTWCTAIRKSVFQEVGGFNTLIPEPTVEDEELGYEMADRGFRILLVEELQVTHLASYTLRQFISRRLRMARAQAKSGWRSFRGRLLKRYLNLRETGTHHSRWVVLSILLMVLASVCLGCAFLSSVPGGVKPWTLYLASGLSVIASLLCHLSFFVGAAKHLGGRVLPVFAVICLADMFILGYGIVQGTFQYATGRKY